MLISAVAVDVISFPSAMLTVLGGAVLLMLETSPMIAYVHEEVSTGPRVGYSCAGVGYGLSWATDRGGCY